MNGGLVSQAWNDRRQIKTGAFNCLVSEVWQVIFNEDEDES
jgi:hypothetical protein